MDFAQTHSAAAASECAAVDSAGGGTPERQRAQCLFTMGKRAPNREVSLKCFSLYIMTGFFTNLINNISIIIVYEPIPERQYTRPCST